MLLYQATHVPVGEDQKQHVELMRDIALKFNGDYDVELFTVPEPHIGDDGGADHVLARRQCEDVEVRPVGHEPDQPVRRRRHDRPEDPQGEDRSGAAAGVGRTALAGRPEALNLVTIYAALTDATPQAVLDSHAGQGFGQFKPALADLLVATLAPIRARLQDFEADPAALEAILSAGAAKAVERAAPTLEGAYRALGLPRG